MPGIPINRPINPYQPPPIAGFTDPQPSADSLIYYVDPTLGLDTNSGLSTLHPFKTINMAKGLMRAGKPDWILLKKGETFAQGERFGAWKTSGNVPLSGRSAFERCVMWSYGSGARPIIRTGNASGLTHSGSASLNYVYLLGIDIYCNTYIGTTSLPVGGVYIDGNFNTFHMEDCRVRNANSGFVTDFFSTYTGNNVTIRRNEFVDMVVDASANPGHCTGVELFHVNSALIEQNVIDTGVSDLGNNFGDSRYGVYANLDCSAILVKKNVISKPGQAGINLQCGGEVSDNVLIQCPWAISYGTHGFLTVDNGVPMTCTGNLIIEGVNRTTSNVPQQPRGFGIYAENILSGSLANNIITQSVATGTASFAISLDGHSTGASGQGTAIRNVSMTGNKVYKWGTNSALYIVGTNTGGIDIDNLTMTGNDFQEPVATAGTLINISNDNVCSDITSGTNRFQRGGTTNWFTITGGGAGSGDLAYYKTRVTSDTTSSAGAVSYANPGRTVGDYHASVGGTNSTAAYITAVRAQTRATWADNLMADAMLAYFRGNFV